MQQRTESSIRNSGDSATRRTFDFVLSSEGTPNTTLAICPEQCESDTNLD